MAVPEDNAPLDCVMLVCWFWRRDPTARPCPKCSGYATNKGKCLGCDEAR